MRLRNKNTGKVIEWFNNTDGIFPNSLAELNAEWEDYEGPKCYYYITSIGEIVFRGFSLKQWNSGDDKRKEIGNYFRTKEEAEKAVEKLKAWKRLKDKGFRFEGIRQDYTRFNQQEPMVCGRKYLQFNKSEDEEWMKDNWEDLDLLFGGEE